MKTSRLILAGMALAVLAGAGWAWQRAGTAQQLVTAALPAIPDLSAAPPALRERISSAEARARFRLTAEKGLVELSRLYHANGFLAEAMQCYVGLEKLQPAEPRWPHLHATIIAGYGEIEPAAALWAKVVRLAPDYVAARLRLGDCRLKADRPAEAAAVYAEVLQRNPGNSYALLGLARIDFEAGRWNEARTRLEAVVSQTNYELGYDLIVSLYERLGLSDRAAAIRGATKASGAYRDPPDPWLDDLMVECFDPYRLALTAGVAARTGSPATGIKLLQRAIQLAPEDVSSHFQLGGIYLMQRDFKNAGDEFDRCTTLAPGFSDGWWQLSALQAQTGDLGSANRTLAEGLKRCPDSPGLHLLRARRLREAGQAEAAINEFLVSIQLRPNEPEAYVELGSFYVALGNEAAGIRQMELALQADPGDPAALGVLAFRAISTGQEIEARRWLNRIAHQPRMPRPQAAALFQAYQQAFGRTFTPDRSDN